MDYNLYTFLQNQFAIFLRYSRATRNLNLIELTPSPLVPQSAFAQTPSPHSPTLIPTPTPMFAKVYPQPPPHVTVPPVFFTIFNEDGGGSILSCSGYPPAHIFYLHKGGGGANGGYGKLAGRWEGEVNWGDVNYKPPPQSLPTTNKQPSIKGGGRMAFVVSWQGAGGNKGGGV